jgi:hypothetical protein
MKLKRRERSVSQRQEERYDSKMTTVVKQRSQSRPHAGHRANSQRHGQKQKGARSQSPYQETLDRGRRMKVGTGGYECTDVGHDTRKNDQIIYSFLAIQVIAL